MKLNPDCIRDILLTIEEETPTFNSQVMYPHKREYERLKKYSKDEILYHMKQCDLSGFFTESFWGFDACVIFTLSPDGHEFLSNIRSAKNWSKTKEIATKVGSFSLDILSKIAVSVVSSLINKHI